MKVHDMKIKPELDFGVCRGGGAGEGSGGERRGEGVGRGGRGRVGGGRGGGAPVSENMLSFG